MNCFSIKIGQIQSYLLLLLFLTVQQVSASPAPLPPPNWTIDPLDFEFNMSLVVRVNFNGVPSNNAGNIVGVFVGNELRGVATPISILGDQYFYISAYSNQYFGETLNFRVYYVANDAIYPTPETVNFIHNSTVGAIGMPFWLNIDPNQDYPPELLPILADTTLQNIPFDQVNLLDYLVSVDGDPVTWSSQAGPNLNASILNGILTVTPVSNLWTGTELVRIIVTENTPNQLADTIFGSFTVLPDYGPPVWQTIPNQTIFPGDEFSSFDLDDFLNFTGPCRQFDFDVFPFTGSDPDPAWPVVPPGVNPMTVIARPLFVDHQLAGAGAKLAAFVNGNLAGWASPTGVSPNVSYELTLANVGAGKITFQFYDTDNQYLYVDSSSLNFVTGGSVGTVPSPHLIQFSPLFPALDANGVMTIAILDTTWLGSYPIDFIVWDCDYPDLRRDTTQAIFTITNDERPQIISGASVNFQENACSALYDTETSDPNDSEGAGLTYTLAGGADVARFVMDAATGILSWAAGFSPDFDNPQDANNDNQYEVNIQVTNSSNLTDVLALTVTITNQTIEPFEVLINGGVGVVCATGNVILTATGGVAYVWSTSATTASITVSTAGTYTVTATSSGACTATASIVIAPPPSITASGNTGNVCLGATIQLSSAPSGGTLPYSSFSWAGPNGYSANIEDPAGFPAVAASGGTYTVTVTDTPGCSATATTSINVTANSAPTITASSNSPVCVGANVNLNSTPSGGSGNYTQFNWAGPNNYTASAQNPAGFSASLASAGTYTVTVTDNAGCSGTGTTAVVVNSAPTITAAVNSPVCVGGTVLLTSTPAGGSGSYPLYNWAGPNSYSANVQNPAGFPATMNAAGTYTVTVTDNTGCTAQGTTSLSVNGLPSITASLLSPVCTNGTVSLGSTPSGGSGQYSAFLWSGPNGYAANVEDPVAFPVTPTVAGDYYVTVTDVAGCTASGSVTVVVNSLPSITAMNNGPVCEGSNITLSSTPSGGSGNYSLFQWTGPDFYVASVEDPVPFSTTAASAGVYQVKVTDSNGCTATTTTTVVINTKPTLTASSNSPVCTGADLDLNSTPGGGSGIYSTFNWTGPANYSSTLEDPTDFPITIANAGTYRVTVTDNAGCTATASTSVAVSTLPAPVVTATSNSPVCGGTNLVLNSAPSGGSGIFVAFSWTGPNNYGSNMEDPTPFPVFSPEGAGIYTVTVTDSKNCKGTASVSVTINGPVSAPTSNSPVCPDGPILLDGGPVLPGTVTYSWSGPNNYASTARIPAGFPAIPAAAGTYSLTITENGCSGVGTTTVVIGDITPPIITCPANTTVAANGSCSGTVGSHSPLSVSDNCAANPTVTQSPVSSTPLNGHNDVKTITLTANDGNGNTASCSFTATLKDVSPPSIICPANMTVTADANCSGEVGAHFPISVSDNCSANPSVTQSPVSSTPLSGNNDAETITLTANDGNGNSANCTFTVTLKDGTPPSITCPANMTLAADANCSGVVGAHSPVTVSDNCTAIPTVTQSPVVSTVLNGHNDVETVTLTADDGNGNIDICSFTVTLKDVTKPVIVCPANITVAADGSCNGMVGAHYPASVSDNCTANPIVTQSPVSSAVLNGHNDVETVTLTADDGNGNTEFCTFTVTLKDITPPSITCPANMTVAADGSCSGTVGAHSPISVSDNCTANPTVTQNPAASTVLNGHNDVETITLNADDGNGNTANCTFTVTLKDITPPSITCPANMTVAADADCSGVVGAHSPVSVSDNCTTIPAVTQSPVVSTVLNGHNDVETVTLTANDGNGNTASCNFTVTLKDVTKPSITCPANTTLSADTNCSSLLGSYSALLVSDNCTANPTVTQTPTASTVLSGHNDFEIVTLTADDGNGNTEFCTFTVTLKDIIAPTVVCKNHTAALDAMGSATITTTDVFQSGADNCGVVNQVSVVPNTFNCSNLGPNTVVLTVNDGNGNTASCNATVTVVDLIPPTMICKSIIVALDAAGTVTVTPAQVNNGSTDNCTLSSLSLAPNMFGCSNLGVNTVTLTGTDQSGNTSTCQSTVTVIDLIKPTVLCKNATIDLNAAGQATLTVAAIDNGSFDNCGFTLSLSQTLFTCANIGNNLVTLTATDNAGNTATCTANVTVRDLILPIARCKNATANLGPDGTITVPPSAVDNLSTDNCSFTLSLSPSMFNCSNIGLITVTLTATDGSGNTSTCTARVTVRDVTPPTMLCKNATIFLDNMGKATLAVNQINNGSTDNCGISTLTLDRTQFNCGDIGGPQNVFLTATDASGNSANCTAVLTVNDNIAPTAICQNVTVVLVNGQVSVFGANLAANSTDNCSVTSFNPVAKTYFAPGVYNLTIAVGDWSGNTANCTSIVTVLPNGPSPRPEEPSADAEQAGAEFKVALYPNPAEGQINLEFELPAPQTFDMAVYNFAGKLVMQQKSMGAKGTNNVSVLLGELQPGIYLMEVGSGQMKARKRVVLQK